MYICDSIRDGVGGTGPDTRLHTNQSTRIQLRFNWLLNGTRPGYRPRQVEMIRVCFRLSPVSPFLVNCHVLDVARSDVLCQAPVATTALQKLHKRLAKSAEHLCRGESALNRNTQPRYTTMYRDNQHSERSLAYGVCVHMWALIML